MGFFKKLIARLALKEASELPVVEIAPVTPPPSDLSEGAREHKQESREERLASLERQFQALQDRPGTDIQQAKLRREIKQLSR